MASSTHYQTLGLDPSATQDQIRRAYRALAKAHHPDVSKASGAERRFARIAAAYEVLSNTAKRREYDRSLQAVSQTTGHGAEVRHAHYPWTNIAGTPSPTDTPNLSEIDDLFDTFFAGPAKRPAAKTQRKPKPGRKRAS